VDGVECRSCQCRSLATHLQAEIEATDPPPLAPAHLLAAAASKKALLAQLATSSLPDDDLLLSSLIPRVLYHLPHLSAAPPRRKKAKRTVLTSLPANLVLHLKRRQFTRSGGMAKDRSHVGVPLSLSVPLFDGSRRYEARAVVEHIGGEGAGHYVCRKSWGSRWFRCSDERVEECSFGDVDGSNVYMVFYTACE
jgi:hypothetical protein